MKPLTVAFLTLAVVSSIAQTTAPSTQPKESPALIASRQRVATLEKQVADLQRQVNLLKAELKKADIADPTLSRAAAAKASKGIGPVLKAGAEGRAFVWYVVHVVDAKAAILKVCASEDGKSFNPHEAVDVYVVMDTAGMTDDEPVSPYSNLGAAGSGFRNLKITGTKKVSMTDGGSRTMLLAEEVK